MDVRLPDGTVVTNVPEGTTQAELLERLKAGGYDVSWATPAAPKESTIFGEAKRGTKQFISTGRTAVDVGRGSPEEAARAGLERSQQIEEEAGEGPSLARIGRVYEERGLLPAAGQVLSDIPRFLAQQAPQIGATIGGARLGAVAGSAFGPAGTLIGGGVGAIGANVLPMFGSAVQRQAATQIEEGKPVDISLGRAAAATAGSAALEAAGTAGVLGKNLVKRVLGVGDDAALAAARSKEDLVKAAQATITGGAIRGAAVEMPVEVAQSVLDRWQAGLDVTGEDALAEYGESMYAAGLVGGPIGGASAIPTRRAAQRALEETEPLAPGQRRGETLEQTANRLNVEVRGLTEQLQPPPPSPFLSGQELASIASSEDGFGKLVQYEEKIKQEPASPERDESLKASRELRKRLVIEGEQRRAEPTQPYPFAEPEAPTFKTGVELVDLVNTSATPNEALVRLLEYRAELKAMPDSAERNQKIAEVDGLYGDVQKEAQSRGFPAPEPFVLRAKDLSDAGIPRQDPLFAQLKDKDLNVPEQAEQVVRLVEDAQRRPNLTPEMYDRFEGLLDNVEAHLSGLPGSGFYAQRTYPKPSGAGVSVAGQPEPTVPTGGAEPPGRRGVAGAPAVAAPTVPREEVPRAPVTELVAPPAPPVEPAFEPGLEVGESERVKELEAELKKLQAERAKLERKPAAPNLFAAVRGKLNRSDVLDIGSDRNFRPLTNAQGQGTFISELVNNSQLDAWLPPAMRPGSESYDAKESEEYIKELLRNRDHVPYAVKDLLDQLNLTIKDLDRAIETEKQLEILIRQANAELQAAAEERRAEEAELPAAEREAGDTVRAEGAAARKSLAKVAPQVSETKFKELERRAKEPSKPEPAKEEPAEVKAIRAERAEKISQLQGVLEKILAKYGLKDVKLNLEEGMKDEGSYEGQLIKLALDLDNPVRTLRHEAIHALKELGFFTPQQWKVLTDRAKSEWIEKYLKNQIAVVDGKEVTRYDAYMDLYKGDQDKIIEEAIADAFGDFSRTKPPAGMMQAILKRMENLFKAIKQAFNQSGYQTAEDVFGKIEEGKLTKAEQLVEQVDAKAKPSLRAPVTEAFKRWFGNSKVVDSDGNPLVMYHGTTKDFSIFQTQNGAVFVTPSKSFANKFAMGDMLFTDSDTVIAPAGANVMPVYVRAERPFDFENPSDIKAVRQLLDPSDRKRFSDGAASGKWQDIEDFLDVIKDAGFDGAYVLEQGVKNLAVFSPNQLKSATGNIGTFEPTSPDIRKSLRAPDTKEFDTFFGDSKIVDKDGEPKVMYHGTARDITSFVPKQAGAIFVTDDPNFAETFSKMSADWMAKHADQFLSPEQLKAGREAAIKQIRKDYKADPKLRDKLLAALDDPDSMYATDANEILAAQYKDQLPTGPNIMPVFVRAENPFDFDNPEHIRQLQQYEAENRYTPSTISDKLGGVERGSWEAIEDRLVQQAIKQLGFDGFYVKEVGKKNLAVYSSNQIKSALGNQGTYDITNADIRKSLRTLPTLPTDVTDRIKQTVIPRERPGMVGRLLDAISPRTFSKFRSEFVNRYDALARFDRQAAEQIRLMGGTEQLADAKAESAALFSDLSGGLAASAMGVNDRVGGIPVYVRKYIVEKDFKKIGPDYPTKAAAEAAAKKVGGQVFEQGYTTISNANGVKGLIAIFSDLAKYKKPAENEPGVFDQYQFWADVKRASKYILNPGTGKYEEKLFTKDDIRRAAQIEKAFPEFVQIQKEWIKYNDGLVDFMRDTGVISEAGAKEMKKHGDYFPFYRHLGEDDIQGPRLFSSIANVKSVKAAKGSEAEVTDFFETIVRNTQSAIQAGIKNVAARRATDQAMRIGEVFKLNRAESGPTVYRVLEDGKETYYRAQDPYFIDALKSLNQPDLPFIGLLAGPAKLLRNLVTKDPAFQLANMMRDSLSAYVSSGYKFTPIAATLKQYGAIIAGKSPEVLALQKAGVIGGYDYSQGVEASAEKLEKEMRKVAGAKTTLEKIASPVTSLWGALEKSSEASDAATRNEIYKRVLAETGNEAEALYQALEVMNFNRKGRSPIIRILTAAVPFMNARIQGLDVLYRSGIRPIYGKDATAQETARLKTFWVRGMTMMALSSMYWVLTSDDEEYKKQEQEVRDNYWLFPSLGIKIPIPFEIGVMFKVVPERILEYAFGSDTGQDFRKAMGRHLFSTFGFNPVPQAFLPAFELTTNHSFFTQRPIITQGMENIAPEYQVGPNTSKIAGAIGQSLGISPIKLDYLIQGYTGTMGMYAVNLFDSIFSMNDEAPKPSRRLEQMPVLRRFMVDPEARGQITAYYDLKNSVDQVVRTSNYLERSMDFEQYGKYMQDNIKMFAARDYINDLEKTMKEFREMKNLVRISQMDADTKRDNITNIGRLEQQLTQNIKTLKKQLAAQQ
jgi:hypothetical protein